MKLYLKTESLILQKEAIVGFHAHKYEYGNVKDYYVDIYLANGNYIRLSSKDEIKANKIYCDASAWLERGTDNLIL